jgi:hypothetical protein
VIDDGSALRTSNDWLGNDPVLKQANRPHTLTSTRIIFPPQSRSHVLTLPFDQLLRTRMVARQTTVMRMGVAGAALRYVAMEWMGMMVMQRRALPSTMSTRSVRLIIICERVVRHLC